ncbi:hypothetical protein AB0L71_24105 [Streptomyces sp. NPDC052052]|uniref:hypothetical protein n=1 Tax=Streptomyces sp. NPDC052052 TaxID=3154756 RepID=UPI00343295D2
MTLLAFLVALAGAALLYVALFHLSARGRIVAAVWLGLGLAAVVAGFAISIEAASAAAFVLIFAIDVRTEIWRYGIQDDFDERERRGLPPLMKRGSPYGRGLFNIFWLICYYRRMKR